jgi:tetratricopeptide (TPR) repeat protein
VADRRGRRLRDVLPVLLLSLLVGGWTLAVSGSDDEHRRLVARYQAGDTEAARDLAAALGSGAPLPRDWCRSGEVCEAAAVLNLDAAARLFGALRGDRAAELVEETGPLANRQSASFAFDWLMAAGFLHQRYGDHGHAFDLYTSALALRPRDAPALLGRATALEASAITDGFGAVLVAARDVWWFIQPGGEPPRELSYQLANPRTDSPYRRLLLEVLTRQYREVLDIDPSLVEARLRLGRVLEARGHRAEAETELRAVAGSHRDPFLAAVARLCLARFEASPDGAAAAYRSALEIDPALSPAWLGLSQSFHARGDRAGALDALERALSLGEKRSLSAWVEYHLGRGRAFPAALEALRARFTKSPSRQR